MNDIQRISSELERKNAGIDRAIVALARVLRRRGDGNEVTSSAGSQEATHQRGRTQANG